MKTLKKMLSVSMIILIMVTSVPMEAFMGVDLSSLKEIFSIEAKATSYTDSYDDFEAIEKMIDGYNNKADGLDLSTYLGLHYTSWPTTEYIDNGMNATCFAPGFVDRMENNIFFKEAYKAWEGIAFVADPIDGVINQLTKATPYKTIIFEMLNSTYTSDSFIDKINSAAVKNTTKFCSILAKSAAIDYKYEISNRINIENLSESEKKHIIETCNGIIENDSFQCAAKYVNNFSELLSTSKNIEQFAERFGTYIQLTKVADETITCLKLMKEYTDNNLLKEAIDTVLDVTNDSYVDFFNVIAGDTAFDIGKYAIKEALGSKWKNVLVSTLTAGTLSSGAVLVDGALLAVNIGKTITNVAFNTDKKLAQYELIKALVATEEPAKQVVKEVMSNYGAYEQGGFLLSAAVDLLYKIYDMDAELSLGLVKIMDSDWIQMSTEEERNNAKAVINDIRSFFSEEYKNIAPQVGKCGENLYWVFDTITDELIIFGFGKMYNYDEGSTPWYHLNEQVKSLHISPYCWKIGKNAFCNLKNLNSTLILNNKTSADPIIYESGCFDNINPKVKIVFPENSKVSSINTECPMYFVKSTTLTGSSMLKELHIKEKIQLEGTLVISKNGILTANEFASYESYNYGSYFEVGHNSKIIINKNMTMQGPHHDPFSDTYYDSMKIFSGATLKVYGNAHFRNGYHYVYSGAEVFIGGNCEIQGGSLEETYFDLYGDLTVGETLYIAWGYVSAALLRIYGTATAKDFREINRTSCNNGAGVIGIFGKAYITDGTIDHNLTNIFTSRETAYLSVKGNITGLNSYQNYHFSSVGNTCKGTIECTGNVFFGEIGVKGLSLLLNGDEKQTVDGTWWHRELAVGTIVINNTKGVKFTMPLTSYTLFNHKQNPFELANGTNTFQDYDNDGLKDDVDPYPLDPVNGQNNTEFEFKIINTKLCIVGYNGNSKNITIPEKVGQYEINGLESLGGKGIESITLSASINSISNSAFNDLKSLKSITVNKNNEYYSSENGILYSKDKTQLVRYPIANENKELVIPVGVNEICQYACDGAKLTSISLPNSLTIINSYSLSNNDFESVTIPENVTTINKNAFNSCYNLKEVNYNATEAKTDVSYSFLFTFVKYSVFKNCSSIEKINIGENVKSIPIAMFSYLTGLKTVNIIGDSGLEAVTEYAFHGSDNLEDVYYSRYYKYWKLIDIDSNGNSPLLSATLHCFECENCSWDDGTCTLAATCSATGKELYVCTVCEKERVEILPIDSNNHPETEIRDKKAPTCIDTGYTGDTYCTKCGKKLFSSETVAPTGNHDYIGVLTVPSCAEKGYTTYTCSVCGDSYVGNYTDANGHSGGTATCKKQAVCTTCGESYGELDSDNHTNIVADKAVDATCSKTGLTEGSHCADCNKVIVAQTITSKLSHNYKSVVTAPTCTEKGYTTYTCSVCGDSYVGNYTDANGHTGGTATCKKQAVCTTCGESYGELDSDNHTNIVADKAVDATCSKTGLTEGSHCADCNKVIVAQTITSKLSHNYKSVVTAPACTEKGYTTYTCSVCGDSYIGAETAALGHCDNDGDSKCDSCGENMSITQTCSCMCHKSGFSGFIWKILRFFYKLFGTNKTCDCGVAHY